MFILKVWALYSVGLTVMIKADEWHPILGNSALWFALLLTGTLLVTGAITLVVADVAKDLKTFKKE